MATYLEFEQPIAALNGQLEKAKQLGEEANVDINKTVKDLEKKIKETIRQIKIKKNTKIHR